MLASARDTSGLYGVVRSLRPMATRAAAHCLKMDMHATQVLQSHCRVWYACGKGATAHFVNIDMPKTFG